MPATTDTTGILYSGSDTLLHTFGTNNFFAGVNAGNLTMTGFGNTASGGSALGNNTTGSANTASGRDALRDNTEGENNTAYGRSALQSNISGNDNTASGRDALQGNTSGSSNIALGYSAGINLTTGNHNIAIGHAGIAAEAATTRIGDSNQTRAFIAGISGVTTGVANAVTVMVDSEGQLGTVSSSRRYKQNIRPMKDFGVSERISQLRPVTFEYKQAQNGDEHPVQFGLIAEEVAKVFPELAVFNKDGQPETVKYHLLAPMLLNEMQDERKRHDQQLLERF